MAQFEIGDKVKFLNAVGGGIVKKIQGGMVYVEDETGFDMPFASDEETSMLWTDPRYEAMPAYPYPGSVQKIDDFIVVKLG